MFRSILPVKSLADNSECDRSRSYRLLTAAFVQGAMLDDSDGSVLDVGSPLHFSGSYKPDPWGSSEEELNGDIATLPGPLAGTNRSKEDFHRMLHDWDQMGYTQVSFV